MIFARFIPAHCGGVLKEVSNQLVSILFIQSKSSKINVIERFRPKPA